MQDVMHELADFATQFAYKSTPGTLTILSISPAEKQDPVRRGISASVRPVTSGRSSDIVSFLLQREQRDLESAPGMRLSA